MIIGIMNVKREFYFTIGGNKFTSEKIPIPNKDDVVLYEWGDKRVAKNKVLTTIDGLRNFYISLVLSPDDVVWLTQKIDLDDFDLDYHFIKKKTTRPKINSFLKVLDNDYGKIHLRYSGSRHYSKPLKQYIADITFYNIRISVNDMNKIIMMHKHKITCSIEYLSTSFPERSYIGRAQEISTNYDSGRRIYKWNCNFGPKSPRTFQTHKNLDWKEYLNDLEIIDLDVERNIKSLLSQRDMVSMTFNDFTMDNDTFSNSYKGLPVKLKNVKNVIEFKFYNFKFNPPVYATFEVTVDELAEGKRSLTKQFAELDGKASVTLYYDHKNNVFYSIMLVVDDYFKTLNFVPKYNTNNKMKTH